MTSLHPQEVELKLLLPPEAVPAFRRRMARRRSVPVEQDLVTRYFDTPDFALSGLGVALRVRRAATRGRTGQRWLQTLKTEGERQGGLSRRLEFEMPVARGVLDWARFPAAARALVPEALRERVIPVFETRFHRTAWQVNGRGGARIEIALDLGAIVAGERSQPLCEIELELKAGAADALFDLALDWAGAFGCVPFDPSKAERGVQLARGLEPAPVKSANVGLTRGMSVEAGFAATVWACLTQFQANLPGVLAPLPNPLPQAGEGPKAEPKPIDDIEYLHQARVALRRLRAALRLYRRVCAVPEPLLADLRALAAALGPARDWDVLLTETLPAIAPHAHDADAWQRGLAVLETRRAQVRADMRAALAAARPGVWLLAMQRWLRAHGWRDAAPADQRLAQLSGLDDWARRALKRGHRRIVRDARRLGQLTPTERHALRIAIKRQRYATEFFQSLFAGGRQVRYLAVLRAAQDSLGRANDAHIAAGLMQTAPPEVGPMGDFVRGWLAARLAAGGDGEDAALMRRLLETPVYW